MKDNSGFVESMIGGHVAPEMMNANRNSSGIELHPGSYGGNIEAVADLVETC